MDEPREEVVQSNQRAQQQLIAEGLKLPGVAEAIEVYAAATRHARPVPVTTPVVRFATGGNG